MISRAGVRVQTSMGVLRPSYDTIYGCVPSLYKYTGVAPAAFGNWPSVDNWLQPIIRFYDQYIYIYISYISTEEPT